MKTNNYEKANRTMVRKSFISIICIVSFATNNSPLPVNSLELDVSTNEGEETTTNFFDLSAWNDNERDAITAVAFEIAHLSDVLIWPDGLDPPKSLTTPNSTFGSADDEDNVRDFLESSWMSDILGDDPGEYLDGLEEDINDDEFGGVRGHRRLSWTKSVKEYSSPSEAKTRTKSSKKKTKTCTLRASMKPVQSANRRASGIVSIKFKRSGGKMAFRYTLSGGDSGCMNKDCQAAVYSGTSCSNIGSPFNDGTSNVWADAGYRTDSDGAAFGAFYVESELGFDCNVGHVVVISDSDEVPIACGKLSVQYECPETPTCDENAGSETTGSTNLILRSKEYPKISSSTSGLGAVKSYNDKVKTSATRSKRDKASSAVAKVPRIIVDPETGKYICPDPTSTVVPCPTPDLPALCDKCNGQKNLDGTGSGSLFACYKECIPSFCCIHDSILEESPSCARTELNCPLYRYCYIVWWKLADTIGPANYFRLTQNDDFFDLDFDTLNEDLKDDTFFNQLFGHYFDDNEISYPDEFGDPANWE